VENPSPLTDYGIIEDTATLALPRIVRHNYCFLEYLSIKVFRLTVNTPQLKVIDPAQFALFHFSRNLALQSLRQAIQHKGQSEEAPEQCSQG
jgi:hypothetical protein